MKELSALHTGRTPNRSRSKLLQMLSSSVHAATRREQGTCMARAKPLVPCTASQKENKMGNGVVGARVSLSALLRSLCSPR